jgi:hypothetical protein
MVGKAAALSRRELISALGVSRRRAAFSVLFAGRGFGATPISIEWLEPRLLFSPITVLNSFQSGLGTSPNNPVLIDPLLSTSSNFGGSPSLVILGTTSSGGVANDGTLYEDSVTTFGSGYTVLDAFNGADGADPTGSLVVDGQGNVFGSTAAGGVFGDGSIYEAPVSGNSIATLASFNGAGGVGSGPSGLVMDSHGNLFGVANVGTAAAPEVSIFELASGSHTITTLVTLSGKFNGNGLIIDGSDNLYGALSEGALTGGKFAPGIVFELGSGDSTVSTLATFNASGTGTPDQPYLDLVRDDNGDLFGATFAGGPGAGNRSTIFEIVKSSGTVTTLAVLPGAGTSGFTKAGGGLALEGNGNSFTLFGTATGGGAANGIVYELLPGAGAVTTLATFSGANGTGPGELIVDPLGDLFGAAVTGGTSNQGTLWGLNVSAPATQLMFQPLPANAVDGVPLSPAVTVDVEDADYLLTNSNSTVTVAASAGTLSGTLTQSVVNGVATFSNLTFLGTQNNVFLKATDSAITLPAPGYAASNNNINVAFDTAPAKLAFTQEPTSTTAGSPIIPAVMVGVEDQNGNVNTVAPTDVTVSLVGTGGTLSGTMTILSQNGVASFTDLSVDTAGTYKLEATAGSVVTISSSFVVVGPPAQLAFVKPPAGATQNVGVSFRVAVEDEAGNIVMGNDASVTLTVNGGPANSVPPGPFTVAAVNGIATFSGLLFGNPGKYGLTVTSGDLAQAAGAIVVSAPPPLQARRYLFNAGPLSPVALLFQEYRDSSASTGMSVPPLDVIEHNALNLGAGAARTVSFDLAASVPAISGQSSQPLDGALVSGDPTVFSADAIDKLLGGN